jgi:High potential iron-sulfur protein
MAEKELSRRSVLQAGAAGAAALLGVREAAAQSITKSPQASARYQDHPNGGQHCSTCLQFQPPSSCKVVAGKISPNGWCAIYAAKT